MTDQEDAVAAYLAREREMLGACLDKSSKAMILLAD